MVLSCSISILYSLVPLVAVLSVIGPEFRERTFTSIVNTVSIVCMLIGFLILVYVIVKAFILPNNSILLASNSINKVYPIPADNIVTIELQENLKVIDINVVGINGVTNNKLPFAKRRNRLDVKVSNLSDGIYIMNITTNKDIQKVKVIIKR